MEKQQATNEQVYVCKRCPFGCVVKVLCDSDGNIVSVTGNTCERGEEYARWRIQGLSDKEIRAREGKSENNVAGLGSTSKGKIEGNCESEGRARAATEGARSDNRPQGYSAFRRTRKNKRSTL